MDKLFRNDDLEDNRCLEEEEVKDDDGDLCFIPEPDILDDRESDILNSDRMVIGLILETVIYNFIGQASMLFQSGIHQENLEIVQKFSPQTST